MMRIVRQLGFAVMTALAVSSVANHASAAPAERFEVTSIKAVRPTLVNTIAALQRRDAKTAKAAFDAYDSAWNGIEVYINTRDMKLYDVLEHEHQARIAKGLENPNPDFAALLPDAQAMLAKYDEAIDFVSKAQPLNPRYDDVARLRIVRSHLREVPPALKAGDLAKARKSFMDFNDTWDSIEDMIKERSADSYVNIEREMIQIEQALEPEKPDATKITDMVSDIMRQYNDAVAQVTREARAR